MGVFPSQGLKPYGPTLKGYIDDEDAAAEAAAANAAAAASAAQSDADAAQASAASAQTTANTALADAAAAQADADTALANAATAQSTAEAAQADADTAQATANTATADLATHEGPPHPERAETFTAAGASPGFWRSFVLDYDNSSTTLAEPFILNVRNALGNLVRALWFNESGGLRVQGTKAEPPLKVHGPASAVPGYAGALTEWLDKWDGPRTHIYSLYADGKPRIGSDRIPAENIIALGSAEAVPANLPNGTFIARPQ